MQLMMKKTVTDLGKLANGHKIFVLKTLTSGVCCPIHLIIFKGLVDFSKIIVSMMELNPIYLMQVEF